MFDLRTLENVWPISDAELDDRLQALAFDAAIAHSRIEPASATRRRSRKVLRGVVLTVAGLLFAAQTGGVTLFLCVIGVMNMVDSLEEDAAAVRLQTQLKGDLERYSDHYQRIAAEKDRRGWW